MATTRKSPSNKSGTRLKPGAGGDGDYYHIEVRPRQGFVAFRTQDVGDPGHIQRVAGRRESGSWGTVKWLIAKSDAHVEDDRLIGDTKDAEDLIKKLRSKPVLKRGDLFEAKPRKNVAERSKPTTAQKKAQSARRKSN